MASNESREDRLVRVVQRLEAKVKSIWEEKKALAERLELATLDKELAEERYLAVEAELQSESELRTALEARISELEELQALSVELEESYVSQKEELSAVISGLRAELTAASQRAEQDAQKAQLRIQELLVSQTSAQSLETLRLELESTKMQLAASELALTAQKRGIAQALRPALIRDAPEYLDTLPFIDFYELSEAVRDSFDSFRIGDISARVMGQNIDGLIQNAESGLLRREVDWPTVQKLIRNTDRANDHLKAVLMRLKDATASSKVQDLLEALTLDFNTTTVTELESAMRELQLSGAKPSVAQEEVSPAESQSAAREIEGLQLRIRFLESKLAQARELAAEIDELKVWQSEARSRESQLSRLLAESEELCRLRDVEIAKLKRAELPTTLDAAVVQQTIKGMTTALQWYSRVQHQPLVLDPLQKPDPCRISVLTGNPQVSALRKAMLDLALSEADADKRALSAEDGSFHVSLDQFEILARIGCIR